MKNIEISRRSALKLLAGASAAGLSSGGFSRLAWAQENLKGTGEVVVFDGGGAMGTALRGAYFEPFEKATGIKVIPAANMPPGAVRASILAGAPAFDVMDFSGGQIGSLINEKLVEKIDYSLFPPQELQAYSPIKQNDYMLPSLFFSLAMAYDKEAFGNTPPKTWADMWNVEKFPGKRSLHNAGDDVLAGCVFEIAMLADGADPKSVYPIDFDRAFKSLDKLKPNILRYWSAGAEPGQMLSEGSVSIASAWNGRISALKEKGIPVDLSWDQAILQWDCWAVLKGSKNKENAMKFLAFVSHREAQAKFSELIEYGPVNSEAFKLIAPDRAAGLPGNPATVSTQVVQDYGWWDQKDGSGKTNVQKATELWQKWITT
ncbi:ABC transporter substrate-binding protein (plasmid) [Rhizobium leguminosarum]